MNKKLELLGFDWDSSIFPDSLPIHEKRLACFHFQKMLPEFVWDASYLEGNPYTFAEVKTLLDGITVGGHRLSDQEQVLNLAESSKFLLTQVRDGKFEINKELFTTIQGKVAKK